MLGDEPFGYQPTTRQARPRRTTSSLPEPRAHGGREASTSDIEAGHGLSSDGQSSRVRICVRFRIAGAANSTIGDIVIQEKSQDCSQCVTNAPPAKNGKLAIAAAIAQVKPD